MATYDQSGYDNENRQPTTNAPEYDEALPGRALNASQKKAIAAALLGTSALGGAAYGLSRLEDGDGSGQVADSGNTETVSTHTAPVATAIPASYVDTSNDIAVISSEPRLATVINDDMTFDEAFAAARAEMGPGDYFEWHGNYYNTFFREEWDGMSDIEHQAFKASLGDLIEADESSPVMAQNELPEAMHHQAARHPTATHHPAVHHAVAVAETTDHANVSVIDDIAGENSNVTVMHIDGHDVSLIDTNNDKKTDMTLADNNVVLVDTDKDHKLDAQGIYDTGTHHVEHIHALSTPIGAPAMNEDDRQLPADYEQLYSSHDLTSDHNNMAQNGHADALDLGN